MFFGYIGPLIQLQVTLSGGQVVESSEQMHDLRPTVRTRYFDPTVKVWGRGLFWLGLLLSLLNVTIPAFKPEKKNEFKCALQGYESPALTAELWARSTGHPKH